MNLWFRKDYACLFKEKKIFDIDWNNEGVKYRDVYFQAEKEFSAYNFDYANTETLLNNFEIAENECKSSIR